MAWHYGFGGLRPATQGVDYGFGGLGPATHGVDDGFGGLGPATHGVALPGIAVLAVGFGGWRGRRG